MTPEENAPSPEESRSQEPRQPEAEDFERIARMLMSMPDAWKAAFLLMLQFDLEERDLSLLNKSGRLLLAMPKKKGPAVDRANQSQGSDATAEEVEEEIADFFEKPACRHLD